MTLVLLSTFFFFKSILTISFFMNKISNYLSISGGNLTAIDCKDRKQGHRSSCAHLILFYLFVRLNIGLTPKKVEDRIQIPALGFLQKNISVYLKDRNGPVVLSVTANKRNQKDINGYLKLNHEGREVEQDGEGRIRLFCSTSKWYRGGRRH
ncbi:hypothetical protein NE237_023680 [Protea cynaroides]|uniref:Uncharacterized protein n=1 Tax=Protea cynaroides TaxID=273540 RepID=A0A9Q0HBY5_9MAGN|nr:hypothetical protein NE237_023680 [Protea cynaroides]